MIVMENTSTGVQRTVLGNLHRLWSFLFGWIYYAVKGAWIPAVISFFTMNGLFIIMPLLNRKIIVGNYEDRGWRVVSAPESLAAQYPSIGQIGTPAE